MADKSYKIINSSVLIDEVKKHPVLYDTKLSNGNHELKKQSWEEVATALFEERWAQFVTAEKDALVREIQVKWKSLRDNFTRVLRKEKEDEQSGVPPGKKKKYLYYDQLMFLLPYTSFRNFRTTNAINSNNSKDLSNLFSNGDTKSFTRNISNVIYLDESKDNNDTIQYNIPNDENPLQTTSPTLGSVQPVRYIKIQPKTSLNLSAGMPTISSNQNLDDDDSGVTKRIATVLEEVVALQKEEKTDDTMGNRKFLLSLLPFMRKLPDDVNLEVRLQLMSVLQAYNSGKSLL